MRGRLREGQGVLRRGEGEHQVRPRRVRRAGTLKGEDCLQTDPSGWKRAPVAYFSHAVVGAGLGSILDTVSKDTEDTDPLVSVS